MNERKRFLYKVCISLAVFFAIVSIILPWYSIQSTSIITTGGSSIDFYNWGVSLNNGNNKGETLFYFTVFTDQEYEYFGDSNQSFLHVISFLILPFLIVGIFLAIYSIFHLDKKEFSNYYSSILTSSIIFIICLILFYIFMQLGIISSMGSAPVGVRYGYAAGFYLLIISISILLACFIISKYISINEKQQIKEIQQINENKPFELLKLRYVQGDITKEEFEQIKKDIEEEK